jgi:predicted nucleotidyltransferase
VPTARSAELRAVAQRVAAALPASVTDIVLTGSTSRGVADELSDIELLVVASELPQELPLSDLETWSPPDAPIRWHGGFVDGEFVELIWWPPTFAEERVAKIAAGEIVEHARLRTAEALVNGICLRGGAHARWLVQLGEYPEGLAEKIIVDAAAAWTEPVRCDRALLRPGDALMRAWRYVDGTEQILRIVFALNREWEPGWKRVAQRVDPLAVKPDRLAERIDAIGRALDLDALRALAAETLALAPDLPVVQRARRLLEEPL